MKKIVVLTGAGISAESGLKTFRDTVKFMQEDIFRVIRSLTLDKV